MDVDPLNFVFPPFNTLWVPPVGSDCVPAMFVLIFELFWSGLFTKSPVLLM